MSRFSGFGLSEHPRAVALVICDRVIVEAGTGKRSLIDIFDRLNVPQVPAMLMRMSIYVSMYRGTQQANELYLGLFSPTGEIVVRSVLTIADWGDGQVDVDLPLQNVPFISAGIYDLRLFVADSVLAQRSLDVRIFPPPPEAQADSPTP